MWHPAHPAAAQDPASPQHPDELLSQRGLSPRVSDPLGGLAVTTLDGAPASSAACGAEGAGTSGSHVRAADAAAGVSDGPGGGSTSGAAALPNGQPEPAAASLTGAGPSEGGAAEAAGDAGPSEGGAAEAAGGAQLAGGLLIDFGEEEATPAPLGAPQPAEGAGSMAGQQPPAEPPDLLL